MCDQHHELLELEDALIASDAPEYRRLDIIVRYPRQHQVKMAREYESMRKSLVYAEAEVE